MPELSPGGGAEAVLAGLLESAPDATVVVDEAGQIVMVNARAEALFGYDRTEMLGRPVEMLIPERHRAKHPGYRADFLAVPAARTMGVGRELTALLANGSELPVEVALSPLLTKRGTLVSAAVRDVSERLRAQRELAASEARLQAIFDAMPGGLSLRGLDGRYLRVNAYVARALGCSAEDLVGTDPAAMLDDPAALAEMAADDAWMRRTKQPITRESTLIHADGTSRDYLVVKYPILGADGEVACFGALTLDVTDRRRMEEAHRRLASIVESSDDAIIAKTVDGTIIEWNRGAERLYGYSAKEAIGRPVAVLLPPGRQAEEEEVLRRVSRGERVEQHEEERMRKDGTRVYVSVTFSPVLDQNGNIVAVSTIARDISERKRFEGQLQYLADHDALSGLFNRRRFEEEVRRELVRARRTGSGGALLAIDLDHFKYVNDSLGHAAGDELIAAVGRAFSGRVRDSDTLARIGGDEFGIFLPGADGNGARAVAASLIEALRTSSAVELPGLVRRVTASVGIAPFDQAGELTAEDLMVEADIAMYDAKEAGRNRASVYDVEVGRHARMESRLTWAERIRDAIETGRFVLYAQPILSLRDNTASRHELLVRMLDDHGDLIPPGVFLYIAERMGLIEDLDRWVLHHGIGFLADQQRKGHGISIELNLSAESVSASDTPALVAHELESAGANPHGLCIEITETAAIVNVERAKQFARRLSEMGCQFALDDFGAGFASFYYLKHLTFDYLKIDGEFIKDVRHNRTDQLVVRSLVEIARGLGKKTIAEFVGDRDALELLRRYGVDYAQGFYVAKPMPLTEVDSYKPTFSTTESAMEQDTPY